MLLQQRTEDDTTALSDTGDSVTTTTTATEKQKLTALDKLLGPEQLSQESLTLENKLEYHIAD